MKQLNSFEQKIIYYGPDSEKEIIATINKHHKVPSKIKPIPAIAKRVKPITDDNKVLLAQYDAKQINYTALSNDGMTYNPERQPTILMYNEYFGGSMNAIVFQEMREARGLAYTARANMVIPKKLEDPYIYRAFIGTQNDKMIDAIVAFEEIINDMPESEKAFKLAKDGLILKMRSQRTNKDAILWAYLDALDLGLNEDIRKKTFEGIQEINIDDVKEYQQKYIKGRKYTYCVLGDEENLDIEALSKYGPIIRVSQEELFGY